jgi:hypothetical protein
MRGGRSQVLLRTTKEKRHGFWSSSQSFFLVALGRNSERQRTCRAFSRGFHLSIEPTASGQLHLQDGVCTGRADIFMSIVREE